MFEKHPCKSSIFSKDAGLDLEALFYKKMSYFRLGCPVSGVIWKPWVLKWAAPLGVLIWVAVEINDQITFVFCRFCEVGNLKIVYETSSRATFVFYNEIADFSILLLIKFSHTRADFATFEKDEILYI